MTGDGSAFIIVSGSVSRVAYVRIYVAKYLNIESQANKSISIGTNACVLLVN